MSLFTINDKRKDNNMKFIDLERGAFFIIVEEQEKGYKNYIYQRSMTTYDECWCINEARLSVIGTNTDVIQVYPTIDFC